MNIFEALNFSTLFWLLAWPVDVVCSPNEPAFRVIWIYLWPLYFTGLYLAIIVLGLFGSLQKKYRPKRMSEIDEEKNFVGIVRTIVIFGTLMWLIDLAIDFLLTQRPLSIRTHEISFYRWLLCVAAYAMAAGVQWMMSPCLPPEFLRLKK